MTTRRRLLITTRRRLLLVLLVGTRGIIQGRRLIQPRGFSSGRHPLVLGLGVHARNRVIWRLRIAPRLGRQGLVASHRRLWHSAWVWHIGWLLLEVLGPADWRLDR